MNDLIINEICFRNFNKYPEEIKRYEIGYGNYVYRVCLGQDTFVIRMNSDKSAYKDTIYWLDKLMTIGIPVPKVIYKGMHNKHSYLILSYIDGDDLGNVYSDLSDEEKREIARDIVNIQNKVSMLPKNNGYGYLTSYNDKNYKKSWKKVILDHLNRSRHRIKENKIFDCTKVDKVEKLLEKYDSYFTSIEPIPFLDDISSKNVLINRGKLAGIIDIDWVCFGDKIYYVALSNMALISLGYDTKYINYLMDEMKSSELEREILTLYTLIFCVDFMSEKGMKFKDEVVKISESQIQQLNKIYEELYSKIV